MAEETTTAPPPTTPVGTTAAQLGLIDQQYARLNALRGPAPNGGQYTREEQRLYGLAQEDLKRAQEERDRTPRPEAPQMPELRPFGEKPPEADPLKAFGSWAVALGILGGALTRTPLTTALNAAGGAMEAIRKNDLDMYEKRRQEWKDATDLAVKNADLQMKAYDVAFQAWREGRSNWASALATANTMAGHLASEHRADMAAAASRADRLFEQKLKLLEFRGALEEKAEEQGNLVRLASQLDGKDTSDAQKQANRGTVTQLLKDYGHANVNDALTRAQATPGWEAMNSQQRAAVLNSTLRRMKQEETHPVTLQQQEDLDWRTLVDAKAREAHPDYDRADPTKQAQYRAEASAALGQEARLREHPLDLPQRLLAQAGILDVPPKEAADVVGKVRAAGRVERLVSDAQNLKGGADVFGEVSKRTSDLRSWWKRNVEDETDGNRPGNEVETHLRGALNALDPRDQAQVFYKKAIFTILDAEREARGGGVLPVAFFKSLTSLLDPQTTSRESFNAIMTDRAEDMLSKTNLSNDQINKLRGVLLDLRTGAPAPAVTPAPAAAGPAGPDPAAQDREALKWAKEHPDDPRAAKTKQRARENLGLPPE